MTKAELIALADRCEKADGSNYDLECQIYKVTNPDEYQRRLTALLEGPMRGRLGPADYDGYIKPPAYTASLDAAMMLVPKPANEYENVFSLELWGSNGVYPAHVRASAWVYGAPRVYAATPALALTAASLRAHGEMRDG